MQDLHVCMYLGVWEGLCAFNLHVDFPSYLIPCLSLA